MNFTSIVGLVAGLLTTGAFLPQIIKTVRTRDTKSISLSMYIVYVIGVLIWFAYGVMLGEIAIIITNIFSLIFGMTMLVMKIFFK
jgi:MtN3 and saliva related transmembrane protein